jgi:hypothetical protein
VGGKDELVGRQAAEELGAPQAPLAPLASPGPHPEFTANTPQITFLGLCFVFINVATLLWFDITYEGKDLPP